MTSAASVPQHSDRWSLESYFSAFGAADYVQFKNAIRDDLAAFLKHIEQAETLTADDLCKAESLTARLGHLSSYLGCLCANDATNDALKADDAWLATQHAEMTKINAVIATLMAELPDDVAQALLREPQLDGATHALKRVREQGRHLMPAAQEALVADLNVDGMHAWGRLYETLTGRLEFPMKFPDGHTETVPMARRRALMAHTDRRMREAAFRDGQAPWDTHADTFAAALNAIAGTRLNLYKRRGLDHFLDEPLFDSALQRQSLEAMMQAIRDDLELPRRALRAAAKLQGAPLHYFDLEAPQIPAPEGLKVSWDDACGIVHRAFHAAYPALGAYFDEMLSRSWIEAQPRAGKRPGAFCTESYLTREQRVYMTHHETIHDVVTLAHEVGHAWHSHVLRERRPFAAMYPMTLAETASNFGEMILLDGLERDPSSSPALIHYLLDQQMNRAHAYLVNIPMRYAFERSFYEARTAGEVSTPGMRDLMCTAQRDWYGDTLAADGLDPMFWASKMHFFITGISFYNFPYVFGYLLSQGLFARFQKEGAAFLPRYEQFLASTGSADCETVVKETLGADITQPGFWADAIRSLESGVAAYEKLAESKATS